MKDKIKEILDYLSDNTRWYRTLNEEEHNIELYKLLLPNERNDLLDYITGLEKQIETLLKDRKKATDLFVDYKSRIDKAVEYLTSYEAIEKIQQFDHNKNNEGLDNSTIDEMTRRYLEVHDKALNILQGDKNE